MSDDYTLRGLHKVKKPLKNGGVNVHYYAWRGGPPVIAEDGSKPPFGSIEFLALFRELTRPAENVPCFADLIGKYEASSDFTGLAEKTKRDYMRYLALIRAKFGTLPLKAFEAPRVRGLFKDWRDGLAAGGKKRKADLAWSVLARVCAYAVDRGELKTNPCLKGGRLYKSNRQEVIWTEDDLARLYGVASAEVMAVVVFALWTGQRLSDCLQARWSHLESGRIKVKQEKRGARVAIPTGKVLGDLLAALPRHEHGFILANTRGQQWTADGYSTSYGKAFARSGIVSGVHFHDLRGTAITRMALAGCTAIQIASVTGHSIKTVQDMLDNHYLGGRAELAEQAISMLEGASG